MGTPEVLQKLRWPPRTEGTHLEPWVTQSLQALCCLWLLDLLPVYLLGRLGLGH